MKHLSLLLFSSLIGLMSLAQIHWQSSAVRYDKPGYQLVITGTLDEGWHIYSTEKMPDCLSTPTIVKLEANPLLKYIGKVEQSGNVKLQQITSIGSTCKYIQKQVTYFCYVQPKNKNVATEAKGTVKYQVCTDEKCLPPAEYNFTIKLPSLFGFKGYVNPIN